MSYHNLTSCYCFFKLLFVILHFLKAEELYIYIYDNKKFKKSLTFINSRRLTSWWSGIGTTLPPYTITTYPLHVHVFDSAIHLILVLLFVNIKKTGYETDRSQAGAEKSEFTMAH